MIVSLSMLNPCPPSRHRLWMLYFFRKCCTCSCSGFSCGLGLFDCIDPDAGDEFYECEASPPASLPCSVEVQREWVVDDTAQAQALTTAVNCSGGSFEVEWRGTVVVDEPIYVADGTTLTISGVSGSTASVDGNSSTRLFTVVNAALHLDGLNVSYGASPAGGAIAATGSTLTFNRTNFVGNSAISDGGAVFVSDASSVTCAHGTTFVENRAGVDGGAMFVSGGSEVLCGGRWLSNSAGGRGGAIRLEEESSAFWSEASVFELNTAGGAGGALALVNSSRVSWEAPTGFYFNYAGLFGGALVMSDQCIASWQAETGFYSNSAGDSGGSVYVHEGSNISWSDDGNTVFDGNQAVGIGGALAVTYGSHTSCTADATATFSGNSAAHAGAIWVHGNSSLSLHGASSFEDNAAIGDSQSVNSTGLGGAVLLEYATATFFGAVIFTGNRAQSKGGALYAQASNVIWDAPTATFSGNSAVYGDGGAIWALNSSLHFYSASSFEDNTATGDPYYNSTGHLQNISAYGAGGAVYMVGASATFDGPVTFTGNRATSFGGAIDISTSKVLWRSPTTTAVNNTALFGGVINIFDSNVTWDGVATMAFNNASNSGGIMYVLRSNVSWVGQANFSRNLASSGGGAIRLSNFSSFSFDGDATFVENEASEPNGGLQGAGGALVVGANSSVVLSGGTMEFVGNKATTFGSAVYLITGSHVSWSGQKTNFVNNSAGIWGTVYMDQSEASWSGETLFEGNSADAGGAVFLLDGSYVGWTGETTFSSNQATIDGGAVATVESDPEYNPRDSILHVGATTTFLNNTSGANGGGLALFGACTLEVDLGVEVSYLGNSAEVAGGAVFVSGAGTGPAFSRATFVSNSAQVGGAVSSFGSGNSKSVSEAEPPDPTTFDRCRFIGNRATTGGAIDSAAGYDSIIDSTFEDNAAGTGGALRLAGTASIDGCSFVENFSGDGAGAVVSNIGTIARMANISFAGNGFNCPAGMFLDYNTVSRCLRCRCASRSPLLGLRCACSKRYVAPRGLRSIPQVPTVFVSRILVRLNVMQRTSERTSVPHSVFTELGYDASGISCSLMFANCSLMQ